MKITVEIVDGRYLIVVELKNREDQKFIKESKEHVLQIAERAMQDAEEAGEK